MNKTNLNTNDVKNILEQIFNGNLAKYRASLGKIAYENANSEKIILTDEGDGTQTEYDLAQYLDLRFYSWKNRLVDSENPIASPFSAFESWLESLNRSMDSSYALVELTDSEITPSQDIDSATLTGTITIIAQTNKIANLDYYVTKIRNIYSGAPQDIQNAFGDIVKAYINIGIPLYESEPQMLPIGECVEIRVNFTISYIMNAYDYTTTPIKLSFAPVPVGVIMANTDDINNVSGTSLTLYIRQNLGRKPIDGDCLFVTLTGVTPNQTYTFIYDGATQQWINYGIGGRRWYDLPYNKLVWQNVATSQSAPKANRPDLTGFLPTAISQVKTISFYDFDQYLTNEINKIFWETGAAQKGATLSVDDLQDTEQSDVRIPIQIAVQYGGVWYVYKDFIETMQKTVSNGEFNITSLTLKGDARA